MSTERDRGLERFLRDLERELTALPNEDVRDMVAELRSNVEATAAERGVAPDVVLEGYGEPAALATGILMDRGLLPAPGEIAEAGAFRRAAAGVVDVLVAGAPFVYAVPLVIQAATFGGGRNTPLLFSSAAMTVMACLWPWFYWRMRRTGQGGLSAGVLLTGVRHIRTPAGRRPVLARDVHAPRPSVWAYAGAVLGVWLVFGIYVTGVPATVQLVAELRSTGPSTDPVQAAHDDDGMVAMQVTDYLSALLRDDPPNDPRDFTTGAAAAKTADLHSAVRAAGVTSYRLAGYGWEYGDRPPTTWEDATGTVYVVLDGGSVPATKPWQYEFVVRKHVSDVAPDRTTWSTDYRIVDIRKTE